MHQMHKIHFQSKADKCTKNLKRADDNKTSLQGNVESLQILIRKHCTPYDACGRME